MNLIVEINGKNTQKITILDDEFSIGRSLENDIMIKDRYVDSKQLGLIVEGERLYLNDFQSTNGTEVAGKRIVGKGNLYRFGDPIFIGDSIVKIFEVDKGTEKTVSRSRWFHLVRYFKPLPLLLSLLFFVSGVSTYKEWLNATELFSFFDVVSGFFEIIIEVFILASIFAVFTQIVRGYGSIREHIIVVSFIKLFDEVAEFIIWLIRFNMQNASIGEWLPVGSSIVVSILLIVGALSYITQFGNMKIWALAIILSLTYAYRDQADEFSKEDHERWNKYDNTENISFPPNFLFRGTASVDEYFEEVDGLFDKADVAK